MNAVTRKLKSKSGISLAIALVFFLLCAMVGTVVLSAASVSAGNTARERQLYRETLALTSAANLLSQDVQAMTYTGAYKRTETVTTTVDSSGVQSTTVVTSEAYERGIPKLEGSQLFSVKNTSGTYSDSLNLTERFYKNQSAFSSGITVMPPAQTIKFNTVPGQNIPEVTGSIAVGEDYTLTVLLQCGKNSLTMTFPPHAVPRTEVAAPITQKLNDSVTQKSTTATYSTILTWDAPLMQKGGATHA